MTRFLLRWLINAVALYAAVALLNGHGLTPQTTNWLSFIWLALIFGLLNAFLRPLINALTCLINVFTLGLFTLIINTFMFWLAGLVGTHFGVGFSVDGFWPAFLGGLIVSMVSILLTMIFKDERQRKRND
jgi:putative membrane protein